MLIFVFSKNHKLFELFIEPCTLTMKVRGRLNYFFNDLALKSLTCITLPYLNSKGEPPPPYLIR